MCDSRRPLEGADSQCLCGVTDYGADGFPICHECWQRAGSPSPLERRSEKRPFVPEWRRRAMEAHEANPWAAVTDLTEAAS